ncbi:MAG: diguanylate cyclase domain-containing protein [Chitinispirillaceae bacterium]
MKEWCGKNRKPTIGFFISELENSYTQTLCQGITDSAEKAGVNLIIFPGKSPKAPYEYQYQYNAIYELPTSENIDALILATGTMINFLTTEEFKAFYTRYGNIPMVSISIPLEGVPSVLIDNKVGLKKIFEHLIDHHKFSRIAYISGPDNNTEAQERFSVYSQVLKENGIEFDPELVYSGDFTQYAGVHAVNDFLDKRKVNFQALAAANDEMALSAMQELQRRGVRVPDEVAVVGFDNVESARFCSPSLTTVAQPIYEQACKAFEMACDLVKQKKMGDITLPTSVVMRESCGCLSPAVSSINAYQKLQEKNGSSFQEKLPSLEGIKADPQIIAIFERVNRIAEKGSVEYEEGLELINDFTQIVFCEDTDENAILSWQNAITQIRTKALCSAKSTDAVIQLEDFFHRARVVLLESSLKMNANRWSIHHNDIRGLRGVLSLLISDVYNREESLRAIIPTLKEMGIKSCQVFLYDKASLHKITDEWSFPNNIRLSMAFSERKLGFSDTCSTMKVKEVLSKELFPEDERYTLVISPLFYMDEQLGFLICEVDLNDIYLFESLVVEISCALKLAYLIKTRQSIEDKLRFALEELERYNEQLSNISQTDELTGLLNRRGFLNQARHTLSVSRRLKKNGMLFFADLDGLKKINDTYGHEEGDSAIQAVASILKRTFRESDIVARLGGDEFTIFTVNTTLEMLENFQKRIGAYVDDYNASSDKPYDVSISIGAVPFSYTDVNDIESLMNQADILLYKQKKEKKAAQASGTGS